MLIGTSFASLTLNANQNAKSNANQRSAHANQKSKKHFLRLEAVKISERRNLYQETWFLNDIYFLNAKLLSQEGEKMFYNLICKSEEKNLIQMLKSS